MRPGAFAAIDPLQPLDYAGFPATCFSINHMVSAAPFKVSFGGVGRTLVCEDEAGTICFTFEISPAGSHGKEKWKLHIDPRPLAQRGETFEYLPAAAAALEAARVYAASRGYLVD